MGVYKGLRYMYIKIHWIFDDKYFNFYSSYCVFKEEIVVMKNPINAWPSWVGFLSTYAFVEYWLIRDMQC